MENQYLMAVRKSQVGSRFPVLLVLQFITRMIVMLFRQVCLRNAAHVLEWCGSVWLTRFTLSRDTSIYNIEFMTYCLAFCCWEYSLIALWIDLKPFLEISSRWRWGILWTCINIYCIYIYPVPGFKKWEKPSILHTLWCWFSSPCRETV